MQDNTECTATPVLLQTLWEIIAAHRSVFRQERTFLRMVTLLLGLLFAFARHTVTQGLLALGLTDADWTAWYRLFSRPRFDEQELAGCLFRQTLVHQPCEQVYVLGVDATQIPRSSQKMPGSCWLKSPRTPPFQPGIHRAQRFVNASWLTPRQEGYSRAIPVRFLPAFTAKAVPSEAEPCREWEAGLKAINWARGELDAAGREEEGLLILGDGSYDCVELWRTLPERTMLMARCARNRHLREMPESHAGRGRPRKYGAVAPHPEDWLSVKEGWREAQVAVRGRTLRLVYRLEGPYLRERAAERPLFLLVVRGENYGVGKREPRRRYRPPAFYLLSAVKQGDEWQLSLPVEELLAWSWQRWELEVAHREMKSGLGAGQMQCWNRRSAVVSVQWGVWLYAILVLAGYRAWGLFGGPSTPARWWGGARRWSLNTLWRGYRAALWGTGEFRAIWTASGDNWPQKESYLAGLWNAVAGAARA